MMLSRCLTPHRRLQSDVPLRIFMRRVLLSVLLVASTVLAGCFGGGEEIVNNESEMTSIWESYQLIDNVAHEDARMFMTVDLRTNETTNTSWAVFDASKGGNCCEHYLATTIEGQILNIGGEYPVFSEDRGHTWDTYIPGVLPALGQCVTAVPTNPGQE